MTPPDGHVVTTPPTVPDEPLTFSTDVSDGPVPVANVENHLHGSATGSVATYDDAHAFMWWTD